MADFCESQIILAKKAYYDTESPIMEDIVYDKFEDYLKIIRPDSKVLEKVGTDLKK
jgi:NAD-dependent DNA ligase